MHKGGGGGGGGGGEAKYTGSIVATIWQCTLVETRPLERWVSHCSVFVMPTRQSDS